jgi:hypothetical protein
MVARIAFPLIPFSEKRKGLTIAQWTPDIALTNPFGQIARFFSRYTRFLNLIHGATYGIHDEPDNGQDYRGD